MKREWDSIQCNELDNGNTFDLSNRRNREGQNRVLSKHSDNYINDYATGADNAEYSHRSNSEMSSKVKTEKKTNFSEPSNFQ